MRLSPFQQQNIRTIAYAIFGDSTLVYLFGSRKDNSKTAFFEEIYEHGIRL